MVLFPLLQGSSLLLWLLQGGFFTLWLKWMKNWSNWGILLPCAKCFMVTKCLWNAVAVALSVWAGITPLTLPGLFIIPVAVLPPGPGILPLLGTDVLHLGHYFLSIFFYYYNFYYSIIISVLGLPWSFQLSTFPGSQILPPELSDLCCSHKSTPRAGVDLIMCPQVCHKHFTFLISNLGFTWLSSRMKFPWFLLSRMLYPELCPYLLASFHFTLLSV